MKNLLVVARYNEDISWTDNLDTDILIYYAISSIFVSLVIITVGDRFYVNIRIVFDR